MNEETERVDRACGVSFDAEAPAPICTLPVAVGTETGQRGR